MGRAKEIKVKVIPSGIGNGFIKNYHYSGKVVSNSKLHFGCFLDNKLHGVLSLGSPLDKRKVLPLVEKNGKPCKWNSMLELNRMAFDEYLPKNSESRCISIVMKLLKRNAPHVKWILSYADGTQCGDGTIYRASGFYLTAIKENSALYLLPDTGDVIHQLSLTAHGGNKVVHEMSIKTGKGKKGFYSISKGKASVKEYMKEMGATPLKGYQLRYIYLIDKKCKITVPILPYSKIDEIGAGMYKGKKIKVQERKQ